MGEVEFEGPPERWTALLPTFADMAFALGGGQTLGIQNHDRYANEAFDALPGVKHNQGDIVDLVSSDVDKELFYDMNADVHFIDPNILKLWYGWDQSDIEEIANNLGPFFGSFIRRHSDNWHDYRYYSLYEAFELMAEVFQAQDRYQAFVELHEQMLETIEERLPPADQRPTALLVYPAGKSGTSFHPFRIDDGGVSTKQWRDLGLSGALAETDIGHYSYSDDGTLGPEALLEIDPEALLVRNYGGASESKFREEVVEPLEDHSVTNNIRAVQNDAVYNAGYLDQGPIINFHHTELAAKDIYPNAFEDATLFDRERVAQIVSGDL
ncbi:ABC transporter substrate-binding protein [Natrialba aegyptia]|uniref:Iron ABC transporter substrate-binding protein n=1 Tax=Natrialba aegyptia DSM 13077 TaxID=1227491 RepID=M0B3J8_9EURY|nr:iron ABC transporter substrate-binding protein [Natrialba aegyptia DSM 13077]